MHPDDLCGFDRVEQRGVLLRCNPHRLHTSISRPKVGALERWMAEGFSEGMENRSTVGKSPFGYSQKSNRTLSLRNVTVRLLLWKHMEDPAMRIRTATDLGAFIRERRVKLGMDQSDLAEKAGTSRKWIVEVEQGKPRAEIGLVLRTLKTLGVSLDIAVERAQKASAASEPRNVDINNILDSLKKRP